MTNAIRDEWAPEEIRSQFVYVEGKLHVVCRECGITYSTKGKGDLKRRFDAGKPIQYCQRCAAKLCVSSMSLSRDEEKKLGIRLDPNTYKKIDGNVWVDKFCQFCGKFKPVRVSTLRVSLRKARTMKPGCTDCRLNGIMVTAQGYVYVSDKNHPAATTKGYVAQHRLVKERELGRYLYVGETVHHINGNRADNRPENLQLRDGNHGPGVVRECGSCGSSNIICVPIAVDIGIPDMVK